MSNSELDHTRAAKRLRQTATSVPMLIATANIQIFVAEIPSDAPDPEPAGEDGGGEGGGKVSYPEKSEANGAPCTIDSFL